MLDFQSIDSAYTEILNILDKDGFLNKRRNGEVKECYHLMMCLSNPRHRVIQNSSRKISLSMLVGEFFWILFGRDDLDFISFYNSKMIEYSDNGKSLFGAYGKRLTSQWSGVIERILSDKLTRQAVLPIIDKSDSTAMTKDFPCNNLLHFWSQDGTSLNLTVYIRSQDMFLGFPYDVFHWTMFLENMAMTCNMRLGKYYHIMQNCHYYIKDYEKVQLIKQANSFVSLPMNSILESCFDKSVENRLIESESKTRQNGVYVNLFDEKSIWSDFIKIVQHRKSNKKVSLFDGALTNVYR
ncbi:hypothetical protein HYS94_01705 [Candidatus Daviesbacteria bacterium]|nr:hypothetical protein [Candidatus Daviesbacteria bacterium]